MKKLIKLINFILIISALIISSLIFINKEVNLYGVKKIYNHLTNFIYIKTNESKSVSSSIKFIKIDNNKYYNDSFTIYCPYKATVIDVNESEIILKCENNYYAYFSNLASVNVSKYDFIVPEDKLAYFIDHFVFYFFKDNERYTYEEVCCNHW